MTEINTSHYRQGGKPCLLYFGGKALIELVNIVKEFKVTGRGEAVHAVNDVSLTVEDGDIFGIIGFSGAGKSTLVRCINLLGRPSSGKVIIDLPAFQPDAVEDSGRERGLPLKGKRPDKRPDP